MSKDSKKVLLIKNIPNPYRILLFNELNNQLKEQGIKLKVVFGALGYARRKWKVDMTECIFDYETLSSKKIALGNSEKTMFTYSGLFHIINKEKTDVIIVTGFSVATTKLWLRSLWVHA